MRHKVMACVMRRTAGRRESLVFEHRDAPEAGVQVPAGTVEPGEDFEAAARRELAEEAGLGPTDVRLVRRLADAYEASYDQQRHVFEFEPARALPDRWSHTVQGAGEDAGMVFEYHWVTVRPELKLAGAQERYLHLLAEAEHEV